MKKQLLLLAMILLPLVASAHDIEVQNADGVTIYYNYINDGTELEVTFRGRYDNSYSNEYQGNVAIPEEVTYENKTCKVTSIGNYAFYECPGLTSVTIPNSVTSIGFRAFYECSGLTSVTIPNSVTSIGNYAFSGCSSLTSFIIPDSVTSIGNDAFKGCSGLQKVIVSDIAAWCGIKFDAYTSNPLYYAKHLYSDENTEIKDLVIPNSVTSIGDYVFSGCSGFASITIPNSVTSIGSSAFSGCSGLTSVTIPNSVTSIGSSAFSGCSGLTSIFIPNSVTWIGRTAFYNCSALTSITIPNNVTSIGDYVFYGCSGLTCITIPNNVTSIGDYVFYGCSGLTCITIPNNVTSIGDYVFCGCSGLTSVEIPNSVTSIGNSAFYGCFGLTSITIPNNVTSIGDYVFCGCSGLTSVEIPNSVTSIGNSAFYGCFGLTSITIPNSVTSIGGSAFYACRIEEVLTRNSKTACSRAFSDRTYQHAMLYIPEGTWGEAVYDGDWYMFNNIREVAMNQEILSPARAYALMDTKSFGYAVFDGSSDEVKMAKAFYSMDENDLNNCWQVIDKSGAKYLYNIGAKKYAKIASDGKITLTNNETPVNITEGENGLKFGLDTSREWGFVKNNNVIIDNQTGINPVSRTSSESSSTYFSLDGMQTVQPKKGLNIVRMSDGTTKKVMMK